MSPSLLIGVLVLIGFMILIFHGIPVTISMMVCGVVGSMFLLRTPMSAFTLLSDSVYSSFTNYITCVAPMFILMGELATESGVGSDLFDCFQKLIGHRKGGLASACQVVSGIFGAICGSTAATGAMMSRIAYPQMKRYRYSDRLATGCIASGACLASLIPPSLHLITYGIAAEASIGKLLIGGVTTGIVLMALFVVTIRIWCAVDKDIAPDKEAKAELAEKFRAIRKGGFIEIFLVFALAMGGMFLGWFTPTEAGAVGFAGMLIVAAAFKRLKALILKKSFVNTMVVAGMIYAMMAGANCFGKFFTLSRIPNALGALVDNLQVPAVVVIVVLSVIYLVLGCFIDGVPLILITTPIFLPVVEAIGYDAIWFGLYLVVIVGLGSVTPPVGVSCYIVSGSCNVELQKVFRGSVPFVLAYLSMAVLLALVPAIATWLPNLLMQARQPCGPIIRTKSNITWRKKMSGLKYPHLCQPMTLRGVLFRNRMFAAPTGYRNMTYDSVLPRGAIWYYARKAMGGAASVSTGELIVDTKMGRGGLHHICIDNPQSLLGLGKIANAVSRYGAVPTAELQHAGMYANRELAVKGAATSGDAYGPVEFELEGRVIRPMTENDIETVIEKYAAAARSAVEFGYRMILVHAGHGWFLNQFMSPNINTRKDKWGGPAIENRARLTVEICKAIRKTVGPSVPIEVRISGSECYDGGYGVEEGIAFAKQLDGHADLIHVSVGNHEVFESFPITHPSMFLGDGCNVGFAAEIKKHVKTPVATIGALGEPEMMEEIIASGKADVVEMARSLLADPDLPNKICTGRDDEINWCMRCLHCFSSQMMFGVKYCPVNPASGYEHDEIFQPVQTKKKKVLVVGGGTGGMQAALTCAEQGHEVILCEKSGVTGGAILCEKKVPFKKKLDMYLSGQAHALERAGIDLRLNTEVTPAYAESIGADVIIAAIGSRPAVPDIPGIGGANVLGAEEAYLNPERVGDRAVIIGAGLVGLELALYLSLLGRTAEVVEAADKISNGGNMLHTNALMIQLKNKGIPVSLNTSAKEITPEGVVCRTADGEKLYGADTVIYAVGQKPLRDEALALRPCAREFYMIGDCVCAGNIAAATGQAYHTALNIGRY